MLQTKIQPDGFDWFAFVDRLRVATEDTKQELKQRRLWALYTLLEDDMASPVDRIKAKALQARAIVPTALASVEAGLDQILAAGPEIEKKKQEAMAPHLSAIADTMTTMDGLKSALDILSNGGPALDPLSESGASAPISQPMPGGVPELNAAGIKP